VPTLFAHATTAATCADLADLSQHFEKLPACLLSLRDLMQRLTTLLLRVFVWCKTVADGKMTPEQYA
jgi:hypothetical protein